MRLAAVLLAGGVLAAPLASAHAKRVAEPRFRPVFSGVKGVFYVTAPRSEPNRLYLVEKRGRIRVVVDGRLRKRPFLDIQPIVGSPGPEQGLFSMAFHPNYARNHRFYVFYTDNDGDPRVVEYRSNGVRSVERLRRLLYVRQPHTRNSGGQLQFGPDGLLYASLGDGGEAGNPRTAPGDPGNRGQNLRTKLAKLLRIDVDRKGARWQMVGYGLRSPWRFSFDRRTGDLYLADRGRQDGQEVNFRPRAKLGALANYGWSRYEGSAVYKPTARINPRGELVFPIASHDRAEACLITGGYVYRGSGVPAARGRYVYGDSYSNLIWSVRVVDGKATDRRRLGKIARLSSFGEDARGELYAVSLSGTVYRLSRR